MFKIGQEVVCIDQRRTHVNLNGLKKDSVYTVEGFNPFDNGLILKEIKSDGGFGAYANTRFKPLELDYEFAENISSEIINKVKEEELVHLN